MLFHSPRLYAKYGVIIIIIYIYIYIYIYSIYINKCNEKNGQNLINIYY